MIDQTREEISHKINTIIQDWSRPCAHGFPATPKIRSQIISEDRLSPAKKRTFFPHSPISNVRCKRVTFTRDLSVFEIRRLYFEISLRCRFEHGKFHNNANRLIFIWMIRTIILTRIRLKKIYINFHLEFFF